MSGFGILLASNRGMIGSECTEVCGVVESDSMDGRSARTRNAALASEPVRRRVRQLFASERAAPEHLLGNAVKEGAPEIGFIPSATRLQQFLKWRTDSLLIADLSC